MDSHRLISSVAILVVVMAFGPLFAANLVVNGGQSDYCIVLPGKATPAEAFAAEELIEHVRKMSGAELKVVYDVDPLPPRAILLGNVRYLAELGVEPDWKELGKEGCLLRTKGNYLIIAGGRPRGTLYGVYTLLEKYWGCRWFAPDTTWIPLNATLSLPDLDLISRPAFEYREPLIYSDPVRRWWADHYSPEYLSRTRNSSYITRDHLGWARNKPMPDVDTEFEKYGGYFKVFNWGHNHARLVPPEKYAEQHPEYYGLRGGKRMTEGDIELCMSNPDVERIAAETLATWMRKHPESDMFFIGQSDTDQFCQCESCTAVRRNYGGWDSARRTEVPASLGDEGWIKWGGYAGLNVEFVSRVAARLESEFPDVLIGTFAYTGSERPPRNIKAHKNVVVWFCPTAGDPPLKRCFCHSIDQGPVNDEFCGFGPEISDWAKIAGQLYVWDYSQLGNIKQPADILALRDNVRAFKRLGVKGIFVDSIMDIQAGFGFMRYWLWTQLLNDPDFDFDRGMEEFATAYYGAAAPDILEYIKLASRPESYEALSRDLAKPWTTDSYRRVPYEHLENCALGFEWGGRVFTTTAVEQGYQIFEKAIAAVSNDPRSLDHVLVARMPMQFAMLERLPKDDPRMKAEAGALLALIEKLQLNRVVDSTLDEYRARLSDKLGIPLTSPETTSVK